MLSARNRFFGQKGIKRVLKYGKISRGRFLSIKTIENNRRSGSRVAVVVSKKVSKKAVVRNRIRRRIYEIFRKNWDKIEPNKDIVVLVYDEKTAILPHVELETSILQLAEKAKLLTNRN
ncbi:ribonuclease P protein component [Candidatus Saccharibacteria bacterium CPR2]|nr:ribonuclease P protein component [Candidatus Saccharibacteria bacterium CPR2]